MVSRMETHSSDALSRCMGEVSPHASTTLNGLALNCRDGLRVNSVAQGAERRGKPV